MDIPPSVDGSAAEVIRRLELAVARRLDGLLHGDHRGLVPGHGSEPGEARPYVAGDDVRRIDWNVTARLQDPHVRDTDADRELEAWLVVDLSPSVDFGTARCTKRDLVVAGAGAVALLTARTGNRLGAHIVTGGGSATGGGHVALPARGGRDHLRAVLHRLVTAPKGDGPADLGAALRSVARPSHRRGLVAVVSDFLAPDGWSRDLRRAALRHDVLAIEVVDPRELQLPDVGILELVDPETGRRREVHTGSRRVRERYERAARAQRDEIARTIRRAGADHLVLRTDRDWILDLARFVERRRLRVDHQRRAAP